MTKPFSPEDVDPASVPKRPPKIQYEYTERKAKERKPQFGWNRDHDVQKFREHLKAAKVVDPDLVLSDDYIRKGRRLGMSPRTVFGMMQQTWPVLSVDREVAKRLWELIVFKYCEYTNDPGEEASGIHEEQGEE